MDLNFNFSDTIYVKLIDEAVETWVPVKAQPTGKFTFRIIPSASYDPELEEWEFGPEDEVRCELAHLNGEELIVAVEKIM